MYPKTQEVLVSWINEELGLEEMEDRKVTETSLETDMSSGFLLGALLHRHNQLPENEEKKLRAPRSGHSQAKVENFCVLEPVLSRLGIKMNVEIATSIMDARRGAAAKLLYDLKMCLDKIERTSKPVSLLQRNDGVKPLPNLAHRLPKPQYDTQMSMQFEKKIRERAERPSEVLLKKRLARFEQRGQYSLDLEAYDRAETKRQYEEAKEAHREAILCARQQEAIFRVAWKKRNKQISRQRQQELQAKRFGIANSSFKATPKTRKLKNSHFDDCSSQLNNFENMLASTLKVKTEVTTNQIHDRLDPLGETSKCVAETIEVWPSGSRTVERVLDTRALGAEFQAQTSTLREHKRTRAIRDEERRKRLRRFMAETEASQMIEYNDHAALSLQAQLTKQCLSEISLDTRLATVLKYRDAMEENRNFRAEQYRQRREYDAEAVLLRDDKVLEFQIQRYQDEVRYASMTIHIAQEAKGAANHCAHTEDCHGILQLIIGLAIEVAELHKIEQPVIEQHALLKLEATPAPESDRAMTDGISLLTKARGVLSLGHLKNDKIANYICWRQAPKDEPAPSQPPGWTSNSKRKPPLIKQEQKLNKPMDPADALAEIELETYLTNSENWYSDQIATLQNDETYALGEAVADSRAIADGILAALPEKESCISDKFGVCLLGGASESTALTLAESFGLCLFSVDTLLDQAMRTAQQVELGRTKVRKNSSQAKLGLAARRAIERGGTVPDFVYAGLVASAINGLDATRYNGWLVCDFPKTVHQAAALEKELTGYDETYKRPTVYDFASPLASMKPEPKPQWPGYYGSADYVPAGISLAIFLKSDIDLTLRHELGRVNDPVESQSYHLEFNRPAYDSDCKARLEHQAPNGLPFALLENEINRSELETYLQRFGNVRHVETSALEEDLAAVVKTEIDSRSAIVTEIKDSIPEEVCDDEVKQEDGLTAHSAVSADTTKVDFPQELAQVISAAWSAAEINFTEGTKRVFRKIREERLRAVSESSSRRRDFANFLARPESKEREQIAEHLLMDIDQGIPDEMRFEDAAKTELKLRLEEARSLLWSATEKRGQENTRVLEAMRTDGSIRRRRLTASRNFACLAQLEVDRTHAAIALLHDYYHTQSKAHLSRCLVLSSLEAQNTSKKSAAAQQKANNNVVAAPDGRQPTPPTCIDPTAEGLDPCEESEPVPKSLSKSKKNAKEQPPRNPLQHAITSGLSFVAAWAAPTDPPETVDILQRAVWHEAALLQARLERIRDTGRTTDEFIQRREEQVNADLDVWAQTRYSAELAVNEDIVSRAKTAIDEHRRIEEQWSIHNGILLRIQSSSPNNRGC